MPRSRGRSRIFDLPAERFAKRTRSQAGSTASRSRGASGKLLTLTAYRYMIRTGDEVSTWPLQPLKEALPLYDEPKVYVGDHGWAVSL